jgi:hypothetical protein
MSSGKGVVYFLVSAGSAKGWTRLQKWVKLAWLRNSRDFPDYTPKMY